jgi:hypothetical protein
MELAAFFRRRQARRKAQDLARFNAGFRAGKAELVDLSAHTTET